MFSERVADQQEVFCMCYDFVYWTQWIDCIFEIIFEFMEVEYGVVYSTNNNV